jgi:hypothetical protein
VFRKTEPAFWDDEKVIALYEGVLRRTPTPDEIVGLVTALNKSGNVKLALQDMLSSHEFGIMMLPDLVNEHIARVPSQPLFFLHVPKTAGTSFRLNLSDALGVPAYLLFIHSSWPGYGKDENMRFWPFWAGHAGISAFPTTHRGITVFRETRSRVLSAYRQQERELLSGRDNGSRFYEESSQIAVSRGVSAAKPFSEWVRYRRSAAVWFLPAPEEANLRRWNGVPKQKYLDTLSSRDLTSKLAQSFARFDAAAWAHDQPAMREAIRLVTGNDGTSEIRRENVFRTVETTKPTTLSSDDLQQLDRLVAEEKLFFKTAVDRGLIPPLDPDIADSEFERTAQRLDFDLP